MPWNTPRFSVARMMSMVAAIAIALALFNATRGKRIIETLESPVGVTGWSRAGLTLADGRTQPLPGIISLPDRSMALSAATKAGVEIARDGRVYGLVPIWH